MRQKLLQLNSQSGQLALTVLIFGAVAVIILSGFIIWVDSGLKAAYRRNDQASALSVAEAGIEYYRWHLAHNPEDYQDGTGQLGPYIHDYFDNGNTLLGKFTLEVTPPAAGSTTVTIKSTGELAINPSIKRSVRVRMIRPSFLQYAAVSNSDMWFPVGSEVFGPIHSNGGIHFDGIAHSLVTSARSTYNDPDHSGNEEFGVHTHVAPEDPMPPAPVPNRPDVFLAGRDFPVPAVDFTGITSDVSQIKVDAQSAGRYIGPSGGQNFGYQIILKTNDTFDLYKVTETTELPNGCIEVIGQQDWGSWSISQKQFISNYPFPSNGKIFVEDSVWVEGQIDTARIMIASGVLPDNSSKRTHITVNNDLRYTNYDGRDAIGLIAQGNFNVGWVSEDDLRIDAAIVAQNGRVGRNYYKPPEQNQPRCSPHHVKNLITLYGMFATNDRYGFAYNDGTGYLNRVFIYDPNLRFDPPPGFPFVPGQYQIISWEEL